MVTGLITAETLEAASAQVSATLPQSLFPPITQRRMALLLALSQARYATRTSYYAVAQVTPGWSSDTWTSLADDGLIRQRLDFSTDAAGKPYHECSEQALSMLQNLGLITASGAEISRPVDTEGFKAAVGHLRQAAASSVKSVTVLLSDALERREKAREDLARVEAECERLATMPDDADLPDVDAATVNRRVLLAAKAVSEASQSLQEYTRGLRALAPHLVRRDGISDADLTKNFLEADRAWKSKTEVAMVQDLLEALGGEDGSDLLDSLAQALTHLQGFHGLTPENRATVTALEGNLSAQLHPARQATMQLTSSLQTYARGNTPGLNIGEQFLQVLALLESIEDDSLPGLTVSLPATPIVREHRTRMSLHVKQQEIKPPKAPVAHEPEPTRMSPADALGDTDHSTLVREHMVGTLNPDEATFHFTEALIPEGVSPAAAWLELAVLPGSVTSTEEIVDIAGTDFLRLDSTLDSLVRSTQITVAKPEKTYRPGETSTLF